MSTPRPWDKSSDTGGWEHASSRAILPSHRSCGWCAADDLSMSWGCVFVLTRSRPRGMYLPAWEAAIHECVMPSDISECVMWGGGMCVGGGGGVCLEAGYKCAWRGKGFFPKAVAKGTVLALLPCRLRSVAGTPGTPQG